MNKHCDSVPMDEFLDLIEDLNMKEKEVQEIIGIKRTQFYHWKKKGRIPTKYYWSFKNGLAMFLQEEMIRKMARIGLLSKDLINDIKEDPK